VDVRVDGEVGDVVEVEAAVEVAERFGVLGGVLARYPPIRSRE